MKRSRALRALALLAVLALHGWTRFHAARTMPLSAREFYPEHYAPALSLLAGRGFNGLALDPGVDPRPEVRAVRKFIRLRREEIPARKFEHYAARPVVTDAPPESFSRVLDVYVAAAIWRLFGIRWSALFAFYVLLSTFTCLLMFLLGRRVGGGFGAGLVAAVLFLASPFENEYCIYSPRDLSPLWFDAVGAALLLGVDPDRGRRFRDGAWWFGVGAAGALGFGWRTDGLLIVPLLAAALSARLWSRRRSRRDVLAALVLSAAGAATVWGGIRALGGGRAHDPQIGFHIAYYGEFTRSNLLGLENSFEALRNDLQTAYQAAYFATARGRPPVSYGRPGYNEACRALYLQVLDYNAFRWLARFPRFFLEALGGLSPPGTLQGQPPAVLQRDRVPILASAYRWLLDPLTRAAPCLLLVGCAHAFWRGPDRNAVALLAGFAVVYAAVLLAVLPENKHFGPLLLPLTVLGARGASAVFSVARALVRRQWSARPAVVSWRRTLTSRRARWVAGTAAGGLGALLVVREHSVGVRLGYLDDVMARAGAGVDAGDLVRAPRVFSVEMPPGRRPDPVGYLLTVETGPAAGVLVCRHLRGIGDEPSHRLYLTRHRLHPGKTQYFFVACLQGAAYDDARTYVCSVTLDPGARFLSARRLDLSSWRRPILSTLFYPGERSPGGPALGPGVPASEFVLGRLKDADRFGLLPEEAGYWIEPR